MRFKGRIELSNSAAARRAVFDSRRRIASHMLMFFGNDPMLAP
jgi:hypothetical protein